MTCNVTIVWYFCFIRLPDKKWPKTRNNHSTTHHSLISYSYTVLQMYNYYYTRILCMFCLLYSKYTNPFQPNFTVNLNRLHSRKMYGFILLVAFKIHSPLNCTQMLILSREFTHWTNTINNASIIINKTRFKESSRFCCSRRVNGTYF